MSSQPPPPNTHPQNRPSHRGGNRHHRSPKASYQAISQLHSSSPHSAAWAATIDHIIRCGNVCQVGRVYCTELKARSNQNNKTVRQIKELVISQCSDDDKTQKFTYGVILSECGNGIDTAPCEALKVDDEEDEILRWKYNKGRQILKGSNYSLLGDDSSDDDEDDDDELTLNTEGWSWTRYSAGDNSTIVTFATQGSGNVSSLRLRKAQTIDDSDSSSKPFDETTNHGQVLETLQVLAVTSFGGPENDQEEEKELRMNNDSDDGILEEEGLAFEAAFSTKSKSTPKEDSSMLGRMTPATKKAEIEEETAESSELDTGVLLEEIKPSKVEENDASGADDVVIEPAEIVESNVCEFVDDVVESQDVQAGTGGTNEEDRNVEKHEDTEADAGSNDVSCIEETVKNNSTSKYSKADDGGHDEAVALNVDVVIGCREEDLKEVAETGGMAHGPGNSADDEVAQPVQDFHKKTGEHEGQTDAFVSSTDETESHSKVEAEKKSPVQIAPATDQWLHKAIQKERGVLQTSSVEDEAEQLEEVEDAQSNAIGANANTSYSKDDDTVEEGKEGTEFESPSPQDFEEVGREMLSLGETMNNTGQKDDEEQSVGEDIEVSVYGDALASAVVSVTDHSRQGEGSRHCPASSKDKESRSSSPNADAREPKEQPKEKSSANEQSKQREEMEIATLEDMVLEQMEVGSVNGQFCDISVLTGDQSHLSNNQAEMEDERPTTTLDDDWASVGETKRQRSFLSFNSFFRHRSETSRNKHPENFSPEEEEIQKTFAFAPKGGEKAQTSSRDPSLPPLAPRAVRRKNERSDSKEGGDLDSGYEVLEGWTTQKSSHVHVVGVGDIETDKKAGSDSVRTHRSGIAHKLIQLAKGDCGRSHRSAKQRKKLTYMAAPCLANEEHKNISGYEVLRVNVQGKRGLTEI